MSGWAQDVLHNGWQEDRIADQTELVRAQTERDQAAGTDLLHVADLSQIQVRANFEEPDMGKLHVGQAIQQKQYLRASHSDLKAATLALDEVKQQVEEDAAITYLLLDSAQETAQALKQQYDIATKLAAIMQDRLGAKLESALEIKKYQRGALQIRLAKLEAEDNLEDLRGHLSQLTGVAADQLKIARLRSYGVDWIVIERSTPTSLTCAFENLAVKVCPLR